MNNLALKSLAILSSTIGNFACGMPEKDMPILSGHWYTNANIAYIDRCNREVYNYKNDGTLEEVSSKLFSALPIYQDCQWSQPTLKKTQLAVPYDFPSYSKDFYNIQPIEEYNWSSDCIDNNNHAKYTNTKIIYPTYQCPKGDVVYGNRYSGDVYGCYKSTGFACNADVLGRDLSVVGISFLGHVGLSSAKLCDSDDKECSGNISSANKLTSSVIEVLNEPNKETGSVVFNHTLSSFTKSDEFWGARYDTKDSEVKPFLAKGIDMIALQQTLFPSHYTYGWSYTPSGFKSYYTIDPITGQAKLEQGIYKGKFRCDTFVYYAYKQSEIIIPYRGVLVPLTLYNGLIHNRDTAPASSKVSQKILPYNYTQRADNLENKIKDIFANNQLDITQTDALTKEYLSSTKYDRKHKIDFLWNLAQQYRSYPAKYSYLLDIMNQLKPYELSSGLIEDYKLLSNQDESNALLYLMQACVTFDNKHDIDSLSQKNKSHVIDIVNFLSELEKKNKKETISRKIIELTNKGKLSDETKQLFDFNDAINSGGKSLSLFLEQHAQDKGFLEKIYLLISAYPIGKLQFDVRAIFANFIYKHQSYYKANSLFMNNWYSTYSHFKFNDEKTRLANIRNRLNYGNYDGISQTDRMLIETN